MFDPNNDAGTRGQSQDQNTDALNGQNQGYQNAYNQIQQAYQQYLGRTGNDSEYNSHLYSQYPGQNWQTPGFIQQQLQYIQNSPEAQAYASRQKQTASTPPPVTSTGTVSTTPPTAPQAPTAMPNFQGLTQSYQASQPNISPYQLPTTPLPGYTPYNISQYSAPNQGAQSAQQQALMQTLLQNPQVLGPQQVAEMQQQQKQAIGATQQAAVQQAQQSAAQRGTTFGGSLGATLQNISDQSQGNLSNAYSNIDINAALQNWQSKLQALGASDQTLNSQLSRATQNYQNTLAGQQAQAAQNLAGQQSQAQATQFALEQALGQAQANQFSQQLGVNQAQFGQNQQLAWAQFLNDMLMGRNSQGLSLAQLQLLNQTQGLGALGG